MDLNSLVAFARIVEAGSFAEAARRMKMPTSTLSRRVADLENHLGVRLLDRSTRRLRLTDVGTELLEHAERGAQVSDAVSSIASNYGSTVSGRLRLSAPPSISDSLLAPLINGYQTQYPDVRVQVLIAERAVDHIADGVDLIFRIGQLRDSSLVGRKLLSYLHRLLASRTYLKKFPPIRHPQDLLKHRLLSFARWKPRDRWLFEHVDGSQKETLFFEPYLSMNDYAGLALAILAGSGVGELPPIVLPDLSRNDLLVEVMPKWRLRTFDLWLLHLIRISLRRYGHFRSSQPRIHGSFLSVFPVEFLYRKTRFSSLVISMSSKSPRHPLTKGEPSGEPPAKCALSGNDRPRVAANAGKARSPTRSQFPSKCIGLFSPS